MEHAFWTNGLTFSPFSWLESFTDQMLKLYPINPHHQWEGEKMQST
jgi:hypothetical protein